MISLCIKYESSEADALKNGFSLQTLFDELEPRFSTLAAQVIWGPLEITDPMRF